MLTPRGLAKLPALLGCIMALVLIAAACGGDDDDGAGTTLRVGMLSDHTTFDVPVIVGMPDIAAIPHMYDTLVMRNPDMTLQPMLAKSWSANDDGTQWTFKLRKGVKFHHGKEFKAEDVIFTYNRLFEVESPLASVMVKPKDIVAVDDYTVRFEFSEPNAVLLEALVKYHAPITPSDVDVTLFATQEFGTGPYTMEENVLGERTVFKKNKDYWWDGHPKVDEVIFVYLSGTEARAEALMPAPSMSSSTWTWRACPGWNPIQTRWWRHQPAEAT
jgi:peptide/nickel transport system substrate-binding protein